MVVIGGGISGLSAAFRMQEMAAAQNLALNILVLEADRRIGGLIQTEEMAGCVIETGPDSVVCQKPEGLDLCRRLGLAESVVYPERNGGIQILVGGRLCFLPEGFQMVAPTRLGPMFRSPIFSARAKWRMAMEPWVRGSRNHDRDESVASFLKRRLGEELVARVAQPVLASIFLTDANQLSVRRVMPGLVGLERHAGSIVRGLRANQAKAAAKPAEGFFAPRGGLARITQALATALPEGAIVNGARVERADFRPDLGQWRLSVAGMPALDADAIVCAAPAHVSARLLRHTAPELAAELEAIRHASCAILNMVYRAEDVAHAMDGNGFFVPTSEGLSLLACTFVQRKFPERVPSGLVLLRSFVGGTGQAALLELDDQTLIQRVHGELSRVLGIRKPPIETASYRHIRAMPRLEVGILDRIRRLEAFAQPISGCFLAGGGLAAVGLPDCIRSGESAAESAVGFLAKQDAYALNKAG